MPVIVGLTADYPIVNLIPRSMSARTTHEHVLRREYSDSRTDNGAALRRISVMFSIDALPPKGVGFTYRGL